MEHPKPIYTIPQITEIQQRDRLHADLPHRDLLPGDLVVSYNIDTLNGLSASEQNVHDYQPQFLDVGTGS